MKQIAQYQDGRMELQEVPVPQPPPGGVLVRTAHSVISIGTEKMKVEQARMNLLQKARARPDQVRKVIDTAKTLGWRNAMEKVMNKLSEPAPLGYSTAGIVEAVGDGNTRFKVGDRVACGGAECAHHAEYVAVPDRLTAPVPGGVPLWKAAYTTVASIAMHAVRQGGITLGDRVVVIGQGLIGLLATNLCAAAGARVVAVDLLEERGDLVQALGAELFVTPGRQDLVETVHAWTGGFGADVVLVCTAASTNAPIEQAAKVARDRGRVVIVGITNTDLPYRQFYDKELDVKFSRSYGPGRYEPSYEWGGNDYPIGYVRWTEERNFDACLRLMASGDLKLDALTTRRIPLDDALGVYKELADGPAKDVGIVIDYPGDQGDGEALSAPSSITSAGPNQASRVKAPITQLDVIGAGNFARTMLLPHLKGNIGFGSVVNQRALSAEHVKTKFGFGRSATDPATIFDGGSSGATLIATRHNLHAPLVKASLEHDRHVFVEKPLCLTLDELRDLDQTVAAHPSASVMVGFNRRFASASQRLREIASHAAGPKTLAYTVVPGRLDPKSWYADPHEGGGRILGEACHFLDYVLFILQANPVRVSAKTLWPVESTRGLPDSISAQVDFDDGSTAMLIYHAEAGTKYPKETVRLFCPGITAELMNYKQLVEYGRTNVKRSACSSKGHPEQVAAWLAFLAGKSDHPLPYAEARRSMLLTFDVLASIRKGRPVDAAG